jgi:hypothetical protein
MQGDTRETQEQQRDRSRTGTGMDHGPAPAGSVPFSDPFRDKEARPYQRDKTSACWGQDERSSCVSTRTRTYRTNTCDTVCPSIEAGRTRSTTKQCPAHRSLVTRTQCRILSEHSNVMWHGSAPKPTTAAPLGWILCRYELLYGPWTARSTVHSHWAGPKAGSSCRPMRGIGAHGGHLL